MFPFTVIQKINDYFSHKRFIRNAMNGLKAKKRRWLY